MDKPLCRVCRHPHYSYEDHVWSEAPAGSVPARVPAITIKSSGKFDRLAYQRDYMRAWRARKAQATTLSS